MPVIKTGRMTEQMVTCDKNGSSMRCEVSGLEVVAGRLPGEPSLRVGPRGNTVHQLSKRCLGNREGVAIDKVRGHRAQILLDCRPQEEFKVDFSGI